MRGCDHFSLPAVRREWALMSEGMCPGCSAPSARAPDGFMLCPCCEVNWKFSGLEVTFRLPAATLTDEPTKEMT